MARYIDAEELLHRLPNDLPYKGSVRRVLIQSPSADVQEVRHGKWISKPDGFACSECKKKAGTAYGKVGAYISKYCPNCGAKMDGME